MIAKSFIIFSAFLISLNGHTRSHKVEVDLFCEGHDGKDLTRVQIDDSKVKAKVKNGLYRVKAAVYRAKADACDIALRMSGLKEDDSNGVGGKAVYPLIVGSSSHGELPLGAKEHNQDYLKQLEKYKDAKRDPSKTIVVLFHGTCSNPVDRPAVFREKELLTFLEDRLVETGLEKNKHFLTMHGPGSGNRQISRLHKFFRVKDSYSAGRGVATGAGTEENIGHALMHLNGLTENPASEEEMARLIPYLKTVGRVVVVGWSRGAATAIQFARELYKNPTYALKDVKVNMLLVDPVPGMGNISFGMWKHIHHLYPNVESSVTFYAEDERSTGFTANIPREVNKNGTPKKKGSRQVIMEMPGNHATLVGNARANKDETITDEDDVFFASAKIVRGVAQAFVAKHTGFLQGILYEKDQGEVAPSDLPPLMNDDFRLLVDELERFSKMASDSYTGLSQIMGTGRKYHEEWEMSLLTPIMRPVMPRREAKNIKGFYIKSNYVNGKRLYINHLHRVIELNPSFDIYSLFESGYYQKAKPYLKDKKK